jgi:MYXO-CTERM domain-containing protein
VSKERKARVAEAIRDTLAEMIAREVKDPRVSAAGVVSITQVEMNKDLAIGLTTDTRDDTETFAYRYRIRPGEAPAGPDAGPGEMPDDPPGGCCSTGGGASGSALLAVLVVALVVAPARRRRAR